MKTYSALFAGFDLAGKGLEAAGLQPINLFEYDPILAEVGQANSTGKYVVADVCDVDWKRYEAPDVLWASPVCKNASVAKANGEESTIDIATAEATGRAISTWLPETVFIENVWGYRHFKAFDLLCDVLTRNGYWFQVHHLNSADFGVPQTRKRLIIRATRAGWLPPLPNKTPWLGWYQAIEDLIPELPESKFADWQLARLPDELQESFMQPWTTADGTTPLRPASEPSLTITSTVNRNMPRAFLVDDQTSHGGTQAMIRNGSEPAFSAMTRQSGGTLPRALLVDGGNAGKNGPIHRDESAPAGTVTTCDRPRAFIIAGKPANYAGDLHNLQVTEPVVTVTASQPRHPFRAWLSQGRVVSMTPKALGRFQTLPDSFVLSGKTSVDCTGIGNGVPSLLVTKLIESFLEAA